MRTSPPRRGVTKPTVIRCIESQREALKEIYKGDMETLAAERIANLTYVKHEAFRCLNFLPTKAPQLLAVILRSEEIVAKIQGVLNEKHLHMGRIQHDVKLYDFEDKTPPPMGIVEGVINSIEEQNPVIAVIEEDIITDKRVEVPHSIVMPLSSDGKSRPSVVML